MLQLCKVPRKRPRSVSPSRNYKRANYQPSSQESPLNQNLLALRVNTGSHKRGPHKLNFSDAAEQQQPYGVRVHKWQITYFHYRYECDAVYHQTIRSEGEVWGTQQCKTSDSYGKSPIIHGKTEAKVTIANISITHVFIVADIVDDLIFGADFMIAHGINLNMEQQIVSWRAHQKDSCCWTTKTTIWKWIIDMGRLWGKPFVGYGTRRNTDRFNITKGPRQKHRTENRTSESAKFIRSRKSHQ